MSPVAAVRLAPAIVTSRRTETSSITLRRDLAVRIGELLAETAELSDAPLGGEPLVVGQGPLREPGPSAPVRQLGVRAARDRVRAQDRVHLVLRPRPVADRPSASGGGRPPVAPRRRPPQPLGGGGRGPARGQVAGGAEARQGERTGLVGLRMGAARRPSPGSRVGDHRPRREGREPPATPPWRCVRAGRPPDAPPIRLALDHHLVGGIEPLGPSLRARCGSCRPGRPAAARPAPRSPPPASGRADVDADHASPARLRRRLRRTGAAGDTDTGRPARAARPGQQHGGGQPPTRARSPSHAPARPHLRAPKAPVPDARLAYAASPEEPAARIEAPIAPCRSPTRASARAARSRAAPAWRSRP